MKDKSSENPNTPLFDDLAAQLTAVRAELRDGGPQVDHEILELYIAGILTEPEKSEVARNVLTWKSWNEARTSILTTVSAQLTELDSASIDAPSEGETATLLNNNSLPGFEGTQTRTTPRKQSGLLALLSAAATVIVAVVCISSIGKIDRDIVAQLNDVNGPIVKRGDGSISGLDNYPQSIRENISSILLSERIEVDENAIEFAATAGGYRDVSMYVSPVGTVVKSRKPTIRWHPRPGITSYQVVLTTLSGDEVTSEQVDDVQWTVSEPLERGQVYVWKIVWGLKTSGEADAMFKVLDEQSFTKLSELEGSAGRSRLARISAFQQFGLKDEIRAELRFVVKPNSELHRALFESLR